MDPHLTEILVCPVCKGRLVWDEKLQSFCCKPCALAFAVKDGIPDMIAHNARSLTEEELASLGQSEPAPAR